MLKDVPVILGSKNTDAKGLLHPTTPHYTATFLVVDHDDYHWILGIPLLAAIDGMVKCRERRLEYTPAASSTPTSIPLISRAEAKLQPVRAEFRLKSPHLETETVETASWAAAALH